MSTHGRFTPVLTEIFCVLLTMAAFAWGPSSVFGQTPPPATFVNPTLFNGGSVIPSYSPIPVQAIAEGDFNNDGVPDLVTLDSNADTNGWGIMLGNGDGTFQPVVAIGTSGVYGEVGSVVTGDFKMTVIWTSPSPTRPPVQMVHSRFTWATARAASRSRPRIR